MLLGRSRWRVLDIRREAILHGDRHTQRAARPRLAALCGFPTRCPGLVQGSPESVALSLRLTRRSSRRTGPSTPRRRSLRNRPPLHTRAAAQEPLLPPAYQGREIRLRLGEPPSAQQLDIDRTGGIHACGLRVPDEEYVLGDPGIEQLDAAELHQLGVALALRAPLTFRVVFQQFADVVEVGAHGVETVAPYALVVVHPCCSRSRCRHRTLAMQSQRGIGGRRMYPYPG